MTRKPNRNLLNITWGDFLESAKPFGVEVRSTQGEVIGHDQSGNYLFRPYDGESLRYPLPFNFTPAMRVGHVTYELACNRLKLSHSFTADDGWCYIM